MFLRYKAPNFIVANAIKRYKVLHKKVPSYMGNHRKSAKNSEKSSSELVRTCLPTTIDLRRRAMSTVHIFTNAKPFPNKMSEHILT
jgi:hypothetical protein